MERPLKKQRKRIKLRQSVVLMLMGAVLVTGLVFWYVTWQNGGEVPYELHEESYRELVNRPVTEVSRITVSRRDQETYVLLGSNGKLSVQGQPEFVMNEAMEQTVLTASAILSVEETLSESREEWEPHKADFGLENPAVKVEIDYTDGLTAVFYIGNKAPDRNLYYYELDGDPNLYLASADLYEMFVDEVNFLHHVSQPVIHRQRINQITIKSGDGEMLGDWQLETDITDEQALSSWRMTSPYSYPCDAEAMDTLLRAMEKLYLGRFVSKATDLAKAQYGFLPAKRVITLHQAQGDMASTNEEGAYVIDTYPESTLTIEVGDTAWDYVDYCMVGDSIYLVSNISQPLLNNLVPQTTLLKQPAAIDLSSIAALVVEKGGERHEYVLRREEQVLPNNDLAIDEEGNILFDTYVKRDGVDIDIDAFEAAITSLQTVTVSGWLPSGFASTQAPSIKLTFTFLNGRTRTLECVAYDALQDALAVDGVYLHYLPRGILDKGI